MRKCNGAPYCNAGSSHYDNSMRHDIPDSQDETGTVQPQVSVNKEEKVEESQARRGSRVAKGSRL